MEGEKQVVEAVCDVAEEFVRRAELARKAADEGLSQDAIKKSVKHWRPDHDRL